MGSLNRLACVTALIIAAGEVARYWGSARFFPMAFDELLIAFALICAAWRSRIDGARWHLPAWGAFSGLVLVLLVETAGHQMYGPPKAGGPIYLGALSLMLLAGLWAVGRALQLVRQYPAQ